MSDETIQAWNARFIPVDSTLASEETVSMAKERRKLPQPPRKLPTPKVLSSPPSPPSPQKPEWPQFPVACSFKFPGASKHVEIDISSCALTRSTDPSTDSIHDGLSDVAWNTEPFEKPFDYSELNESALRGSLSNLTDSRRTSASTVSSDVDRETAPTSRSSAGYSSIFSNRRHSARTTLLTEIDDYNDTVVKDLAEVAPELVLQVKNSLLRELRTRFDGLYDDVEVPLQSPIAKEVDKELEDILSQLRAEEKAIMSLKDTHAELLRRRAGLSTKLERGTEGLNGDKEGQIYNLRQSTANLLVEPPEYTLRHSQVVQQLEEAVSQLRANEVEISGLRDMNVELIRRRTGLVTEFEQQNEELRRTLADREDQILNQMQATGDFSVDPPEYTLIGEVRAPILESILSRFWRRV
jgi:hypothetical protein